MSQPFAVIQTTFEDDEESDEDENADFDDGMDCKNPDDEMEITDEVEGGNKGREKAARLEAMRAEKEELDLPGRARFKRESPIWKGLMRSKGQSLAIYRLILSKQKSKLT